MPTFSKICAGLAASFALVGALPAQAQLRSQVPMIPKFPDVCMSFNGDTARRTQKYDELLGTVIERLRSYSGWAALQERVKVAELPYEGLCPSLQVMSPLGPHPQSKSIAINLVADNSTNPPKPVAPEIAAKAVKDDQYPIAGHAAHVLSIMTTETVKAQLFDRSFGLNSLAFLITAAHTTGATEQVLLAVEAAVNDNRNAELDFVYKYEPEEESPLARSISYHLFSKMTTEINDIHAQAIVAKAQNRTLSENERNKFRQEAFKVALKDPQIRAMAAQQALMGYKQTLTEEIEEDKPLADFEMKPFDAVAIKERVKHLPGKLGESDFNKDYAAYWAAKAANDPIPQMEAQLKALVPQMRIEIEKAKRAQQGTQQFRQQIQPQYN